MRLVLRTSLVLSLVVAQGCLARADQPYFRYNPCAGGAASAACNPVPSAGSGTGTDAGAVKAAPLAFSRAEQVGNGAEMDSVSANFAAAGGAGGYAMSLLDAPMGFFLIQLDATRWSILGSMFPAGSYPNARVVLTDADGDRVVAPIPTTVSDGSAPQPPAGFSFSSVDDLPDGRTMEANTADFALAGGKAPYTYALGGAPATTYVSTGNVSSTSGQVVAVVDAPGTYSGMSLTVTDATGTSIVHQYPAFTVSARPGASALAVSGLDQPPATIPVGTTWTSKVFTVSGGNGASGYAASLENGPGSPSGVQAVGTGANGPNQFQVTIAGSPESVGSYPSPQVRVTSVADGTQSKLATLSATKVTGDPLAVVTPYPASTTVAAQSAFAVTGGFRGGSGSYDYSFTGYPDDGSAYVQESATSSGYDLAFNATVPDATTYTVTVSALDRKTGERLDFPAFTLTGKAQRLTACTNMAKGAGMLTAAVGGYASNGNAVTWSGGVGPYTLSPSQPLPSGLGLRFDPSFVGSDAVRGLPAELEPTDVASVTDLPATLRDSKGSTCTVLLNASSSPAIPASRAPGSPCCCAGSAPW